MTAVYATSAFHYAVGNEASKRELEQFQRLAEYDKVGKHTLVSTPEAADYILFLEPGIAGPFFWRYVLNHPLYRRYKDRCLTYCPGDKPHSFIPGIYPSLDRRFYNAAWARSGQYLHIRENQEIFCKADAEPREYLYSFAGSFETHKLRRNLIKLSGHHRGFILDTAERKNRIRIPKHRRATEKRDKKEWKDYRYGYGELIRSSKFVLCPRGHGASSYRIFETMICGRVPVIISDDWIAPDGPVWSDFSIRVPQAQLSAVAEVLEAHEQGAPEMGMRARLAYEKWFSTPVAFSTLVDAGNRILECQMNQNRPALHPVRTALKPSVSAEIIMDLKHSLATRICRFGVSR